jgi:DNA-binding NtrC family response regulator
MIVDSDERFRRSLKSSLRAIEHDLEVRDVDSVEDAVAEISRCAPDLLLAEIGLSGSRDRGGVALVHRARKIGFRGHVTLMIPFADAPAIREAKSLGFYGLIDKTHLPRAALQRELDAARAARSKTGALAALSAIVGESNEIREIREGVVHIAAAPRSHPVLITGDTGTGKEVVAHAIHSLGCGDGQPFMDLNCSALTVTLVESELFGHERGSFTGAARSTQGRFQAARAGTLFLDEIGDFPLEQQPKLLRVLEDRAFSPVGSSRKIPLLARILAATNKNLLVQIEKGLFRRDLFHRLDTLWIHIPPLAERRDDISLLVEHFAKRIYESDGRLLLFAPDAIEWFRAQSWPGNVRQLRNLIKRISVHAEPGMIDARAVAAIAGRPNHGNLRATDAASPRVEPHQQVGTLRERVYQLELGAIEAALRASGGCQALAARSLGLDRRSLARRVERFGLGSIEGPGLARATSPPYGRTIATDDA